MMGYQFKARTIGHWPVKLKTAVVYPTPGIVLFRRFYTLKDAQTLLNALEMILMVGAIAAMVTAPFHGGWVSGVLGIFAFWVMTVVGNGTRLSAQLAGVLKDDVSRVRQIIGQPEVAPDGVDEVKCYIVTQVGQINALYKLRDPDRATPRLDKYLATVAELTTRATPEECDAVFQYQGQFRAFLNYCQETAQPDLDTVNTYLKGV